MKFAELRETLVKQTDQKAQGNHATPRRISAFEPGTNKVKRELLKSIADDIQWPTYNRARRRASGQVKGAKRLHKQIPPHPLSVLNAAHRIERKQLKMLAKMDARLDK